MGRWLEGWWQMIDARDHLVDAVSRLMGATERPVQRDQVLRVMSLCWRMLPAPVRARFLRGIDVQEPFDFIDFEPRWPELADPELERAARHWSYVIRELAGKDLDFAKSIVKLLRQSRKPTDKQAAWMKQLYRQWKSRQLDGDVDTQVVE